VQPSTELPEHVEAEVHVNSASAVEGFANLLADSAGKTVHVYVRQGTAAEQRLKPGAEVHLRLRRGGPSKIFAHPD